MFLKTTSEEKLSRLISALMLGGCLAFYLFFAFYDGAVICVDSPSYITMDISREPLYSLLLAAFRTVFGGLGEYGYLTAVAFFQSILAAYAAWWLADYVRKALQLPAWVGTALACMPLAVSLLCRFAARRGSMYSNSILTEGITISCYLIFFRYLLEFYFSRTRKSLAWCCLLSFLMISARKQMAISLAMLLSCIIFTSLPASSDSNSGLKNGRRSFFNLTALPASSGSNSGLKSGRRSFFNLTALPALAGVNSRLKNGVQPFFNLTALLPSAGLALVCTAAILGGTAVLDLGYNYAVRGEAVRHSSDGRFLTTMAFYVAEREDAAYLEQEDIRGLFLEIYDRCEEQGYLKHSAGKGWLNRVSHFGDHYDHIQIDTMWPAVNDYVREHYGEGTVELNENADRIMDTMNRALLPHNLGKILASFFDNFLSGLITTVAQRNRILNWYSLAVYLLYGVLLIWNLREGRRQRLAGYAAGFAGLTLLSIVFNVGLVSLVIFCQTRYTIYNMALFYMSLILMLYSFLAGRRGGGHAV